MSPVLLAGAPEHGRDGVAYEQQDDRGPEVCVHYDPGVHGEVGGEAFPFAFERDVDFKRLYHGARCAVHELIEREWDAGKLACDVACVGRRANVGAISEEVDLLVDVIEGNGAAGRLVDFEVLDIAS